MLLKFFKFTSVSVLLITVIIITLLSFLCSNTGFRFTLNTIKNLIPELTIGYINGDIRDFVLSNVSYKTHGIYINVNKIKLSIRLICLMHGEFYIKNIGINNIIVNIDTSKILFLEKKNNFKLNKIKFPFFISLNKICIDLIDANINNINVNLTKIITSFIYKNKNISITNTSINNLEIYLSKLKGKEYDLRSFVINRQIIINQFKLFFNKLVKLQKIFIPININLKEFILLNFKLIGKFSIIAKNLNLDIFNKGQDIFIKQFIVDTSKTNIYLFGNIKLKDNWPIYFNGICKKKIEVLNNKKIIFLLKGNFFNKLNFSLKTYGIINGRLNFQTDFSQIKFPFLLTLDSNEFIWPFIGDVKYKFNNIHLCFKGNLSNYYIFLRGIVIKQNFPTSTLLLYANGNKDQIEITNLFLTSLQGKANIVGIINWSNGINWNTKLTLSNINIEKQFLKLPIKVNGSAEIKGSIYKKLSQFEINNIFLDGKFKNNTLKARGKIKINSLYHINIKDFNLSIGKNYINLNGFFENEYNINAKIKILELNELFSCSKGIIVGSIKLRGSLRSIVAFLDFNISNIDFKNYFFIKKAKISGSIIFNKQISGEIFISLHQLKQSNFILNNININICGNEKQHILTMNIVNNRIVGKIDLSGSFDRVTEIWDGRIRSSIFDIIIDEWKLTQSVFLKYINKTKKIIVGDHCWENKNALFCIPKSFEISKTGNISIVLNHFNSKILEPFLHKNIRINGIFYGKIDIFWKKNSFFPEIILNLKGNKLQIFKFIENKFLFVDFNSVTLNAEIKNNKLNLNWLFKTIENGKFEGNIEISDIKNKRLLFGKLKINTVVLNLIKPLSTEKEDISGILNANLILKGTINNLLINGDSFISDINIESSAIPFIFNKGILKIVFNGFNLIMNGFINVENGLLNINGKADWHSFDSWHANIAIQGNSSNIELPQIGKCDAQLDILIEASQKFLVLNGSLYIPLARIIIQKTPEFIVKQSSDIIILDNKNINDNRNRKNLFDAIQINLNIKFGNDVQIDAFGLKANLTGLLKINQNTHGLHINGQIDIQSGRVFAYGQDLLIRNGQILFSGPADQPFLNFEAIRNPDNTSDGVIVGITLVGFIDKLKINIFSDQLKTQQEAISYLLKGESTYNFNNDTTFNMTSMLISLGVSKSGYFLEKLGKTFGITDLVMDIHGSGNKSQFILSGKVTNNLQIKYMIGIFDSLNAFTLRYRLMPKLYLEAVSGINHALDIIYQLNF
ncbi:Translocation and assembly module TamB [Candidatus Providencia siddallii]|uniref:Translocation and assembly module TamB n=1 Tax=Candidatus Providencia siddallii TaxID=1715285 RepID=A0A0M6W9H2_9GAMM|nr:Translocation and assembly module TamB [Candidatus Providencia siddallii]